MEKCIITISREFGSGGRTIGKKIAENLGIPCLDSEIITKIAEESGFVESYVKKTEETYSNNYLSPRLFGLANEDILWNAQRKVILDQAKNGSCVIVGRCADYILQDREPTLKVFVHASKEFRANRIVEVYGEREESPMQRINAKDKQRAAYHRFYTDMKWGHAQNYDICLDSESLGIDTCAEIVEKLYQEKTK